MDKALAYIPPSLAVNLSASDRSDHSHRIYLISSERLTETFHVITYSSFYSVMPANTHSPLSQ